MSRDTHVEVSAHQYRLRSYARVRADAAGTITREGSSEAAGNTGIAKTHGGRDTRTGRFLRGHRFWASRSSSGPAPKFADAKSLWKACVSYFGWVDDNPLYEDRIVTFQGRVTHVPLRKMRAMTKGDLCRFLGIARSTWDTWKKDRLDLDLTIEKVESVIWVWNFNGAAAGLLDAGIVLRQLGRERKAER